MTKWIPIQNLLIDAWRLFNPNGESVAVVVAPEEDEKDYTWSVFDPNSDTVTVGGHPTKVAFQIGKSPDCASAQREAESVLTNLGIL